MSKYTSYNKDGLNLHFYWDTVGEFVFTCTIHYVSRRWVIHKDKYKDLTLGNSTSYLFIRILRHVSVLWTKRTVLYLCQIICSLSTLLNANSRDDNDVCICTNLNK